MPPGQVYVLYMDEGAQDGDENQMKRDARSISASQRKSRLEWLVTLMSATWPFCPAYSGPFPASEQECRRADYDDGTAFEILDFIGLRVS